MARSVSGIEIAEKWREDTCASVRMYNDWFMRFAPKTYIDEKINAEKSIQVAMDQTNNFINLSHELLIANPTAIEMIRMATTPPLASDRLMGLAEVPSSVMDSLENGRLPPKMSKENLEKHLKSIVCIIAKLLDKQLMPWLDSEVSPAEEQIQIAKMVLSDRLCASYAGPIIRNAQEARQFNCIRKYLERKKYVEVESVNDFRKMEHGTFSFHVDVPVSKGKRKVHMPIDVVIMPKKAKKGELPLLVECKSAGDYANVNKRRKEESEKMSCLIATYGDEIRKRKLFKLFLCGYFNNAYLSFEADSGIDWIWEHKVEDFGVAGV